jgi:hypothetical protein
MMMGLRHALHFLWRDILVRIHQCKKCATRIPEPKHIGYKMSIVSATIAALRFIGSRGSPQSSGVKCFEKSTSSLVLLIIVPQFF